MRHPSLQQLLPDDAAWTIVVHKGESRPLLVMQIQNDRINTDVLA